MSNETKTDEPIIIVDSEFVKALKALPSSVQRTDLVTVKMINPASGKNYTSKDKKVLGIPEDHETTWVPFHLSTWDNTKFATLAKVIGRPSFQLGAEILQQWMRDHMEEIDEAVNSHLKEEKTEEQLTKEIEAMKRKLEAAMTLLTSKKG